jgi:ubiquinone/menaquinone biosynthesis C-methylase UbiE
LSQPGDTAARYDQIAEVYDETREPLTTRAIDNLAALLLQDGSRMLLEAGVGTGRISLPLQQRQFEIVGVDLSKGMVAKARGKGVRGLILADANQLPFRDKEFDAAIMAHVLHLLDNPVRTFKSLNRVATHEVVILVTKRGGGSTSESETSPLRDTFRRVAAELGYPRRGDADGRGGIFQKENDFLTTYPPSSLVTLEDREIVTSTGERLSILERRAFGHLRDIPEDTFMEIIRRVRESVDTEKEIRYRRIEQAAVWRITS